MVNRGGVSISLRMHRLILLASSLIGSGRNIAPIPRLHVRDASPGALVLGYKIES